METPKTFLAFFAIFVNFSCVSSLLEHFSDRRGRDLLLALQSGLVGLPSHGLLREMASKRHQRQCLAVFVALGVHLVVLPQAL